MNRFEIEIDLAPVSLSLDSLKEIDRLKALMDHPWYLDGLKELSLMEIGRYVYEQFRQLKQ